MPKHLFLVQWNSVPNSLNNTCLETWFRVFWAVSGRQTATDFFSRGFTHFFNNLQSLSPDGIALMSGWLHAVFTVHILQFVVWKPVQTGALGSWCLLGCLDIYANMSSLWLVSAEVFGHFFKHRWASGRFL